MAIRQARVLYDFDGEPGTGEISIREGEILTLSRTDVGEGWWEGKNSRGETGLFPEAYVQEVFEEDIPPPALAPPPLPQDYNAPAPGQTPVVEDWSADPWTVPPVQQNQQQNDWQADDDWDSDFDEESASQVGGPNSGGHPPAGQNNLAQYQSGSGPAPFQLPVPSAAVHGGSIGDISAVGKDGSRKTSSKTSFNRFSVFVKSGSENYILGKVNFSVPDADVITVLEQGEGRYNWLATKAPYSCVIASPKKEAKFKGLKSFIAYQLTPSFNNIQVSRRYKHFDWLHERLVTKFSFIPIPPLPDKQIQGRYEEEFIEHRMNQLQSFVDRVCRHPILSQSEVWNHFLTCTDDKRWKVGKRKAEKDVLVGGSAFLALKVPDKPLEAEVVEREVLTFSQFSTQFDVAVRNLAKTAADQTTKCQNHYKREFQSIGKTFTQLGQAMEQDGGNYNPGLNSAVVSTGECYEEIGRLYEEQPRLDWEHLADMMHDYRGLLSGWPQILHVHSGAMGRCRELVADGKLGAAESAAIKARTDNVSYAVLAEVNNFHEQRVKDIKSAHQHFLQEQIKFYQKITEKLQETLRMYDQC